MIPRDVMSVTAALGLRGRDARLVYELSLLRPPGRIELPAGDVAHRMLTRLGLSDLDADEAMASRPEPDGDPHVWWLLERCVAHVVARMGTVGPISGWPDLDDAPHPAARFLYAWVFVAALPSTLAYHRSRGIPERDSWSILSALGTQMANRRALFGSGGLHTQNWVNHHYRGALYSIGPLHVERTYVTFDAGDGPRPGEPALSLHIPEGRLDPAAIDRALDQTRRFFDRHFGDEGHRYAICGSWVLDPQLRGILRPDTNILRFQERFTLIPDEGEDYNATIVEFLFKQPLSVIADLPRETSLQRGVLGHIEAGGIWRSRVGWFAL